jgi:hypothetical protein
VIRFTAAVERRSWASEPRCGFMRKWKPVRIAWPVTGGWLVGAVEPDL